MSTPKQAAHIRMGLSTGAGNVALVRQVFSGFAAATSLSGADFNDIATALTEACNNASAHAYGGDEGPLEVELVARGDATVLVTVRDLGVGLALHDGLPVEFPADVDGELAGIGVPSIKALAKIARWSKPAGGGTEVQMTFSAGPLAWEGGLGAQPPREPVSGRPARLAGAIEVAMAPVSIARAVLPRLLRVMASRAQFSVERHADVQRVAAAVLGADTSSWTASGVQARLHAGPDSLEVAIGPISDADLSRLALAACADEPQLRVSTQQLDGGPQRLVLHL